MHSGWDLLTPLAAAGQTPLWLANAIGILKVVIGFSLIIFVHELGHFLAAKWAGIRVDRFAIGFGYRVLGWRRGEGLTFGPAPNYTPQELRQRGYGETDYCLKILPFGGYVKMLGQEDIVINEQTGEIRLSDDPRAFTNRSVGARMLVVSAGVVFNILFAILGFMIVFLVGKPEIAPRLGVMDAASPAARGGLRPGDVVIEANGHQVESFRDIIVAQVLAEDGHVRLRVQRDGIELPDEFVVQVGAADEQTLLSSGLVPFGTNELLADISAGPDQPELKVGDQIVRVGDQPVDSAIDVLVAFNRYVERTGQTTVPLTVERPGRGQESPEVFQVLMPAALHVRPGPRKAGADSSTEVEHILGFCQRRVISLVEPGKPADRAGLKPGDVIVQWADILNPLYGEIVRSIQASGGRPIPVVVRRGDKVIRTEVTPTRPLRLFRSAPLRVGIGFGRGEEQPPVVADTVPGTPAGRLGIPRGAELVAIDGQQVKSWFEVVRALKAAAGRTVPVRWRVAGVESQALLTVPSSLINELGLPAEARILAINGRDSLRVEGQPALRLPSPSAVAALLEQYPGQTVRVTYQASLDDLTIHEAQFYVQPDLSNADPWQMRVLYGNPELQFRPQERRVRASGPLHAVYLGGRQTGAVLVEVYRSVRSIARSILTQRTGTMEQVSGPVGIVNVAIDRARQGFPELLFFLAFLSVNLAVINFIPFPVVDGGLMVFLIIEKIKGRPLSLRTQMVATLVGLATIVLVFLLVTFKDISRLIG